MMAIDRINVSVAEESLDMLVMWVILASILIVLLQVVVVVLMVMLSIPWKEVDDRPRSQ